MIFDEEFDQSLWCIIKGDKKNRNKIVNFIKELPQEFIEMIRNGIEEYRKIEDPFESDEEIFGEYETQNNVIYHFDIIRPCMNNYLRLSKFILNEKLDDSEIRLELTDGGVKDISEWDNFDEWDLGVSTTDIINNFKNGLMKCNESEYAIVKTPIGSVVRYTRGYLGGLVTLPFGRFVNIKNMPDDITKEDLDAKKIKLLK